MLEHETVAGVILGLALMGGVPMLWVILCGAVHQQKKVKTRRLKSQVSKWG